MITKIKVQNVRGFGETNNEMDVEIFPNKLNLLVAPNGFGKSSIFKAFEGLHSNKLEIVKEDKFNYNAQVMSALSIIENNNTYIANPHKNDLYKEFNIHCINSSLKVKVTKQNLGGYVHANGHLVINSDKALMTVPENITLDYNVKDMRSILSHGKSNMYNLVGAKVPIQLFQQGLSLHIENLKKLTGKRKQDAMEEIISLYNTKSTSSMNQKLSSIREDHSYSNLYEYINNYIHDEINCFMVLYQIVKLYKKNKSNLTKWIVRQEYISFKQSLQSAINDVCKHWKKPEIHERRKKNKIQLYVDFPKAIEVSNGQRDMMCLVIKLYFLLYYKRNKKRNIIIIDEVFDYLDECNITVVQYFLSKLIEQRKGCNDYFILFTHICPNRFDAYVLRNKIKVQYLLPEQAINTPTQRMLCRGTMAKELENYISHYLLHFTNKPEIDKSALMKEYGLKETWGKPGVFNSYINEEIKKYLTSSEQYDPYAVCIAVRVHIEKQVCATLPHDYQEQFINTHKTKEKLKIAENHVEINDLYYLLSIIYNEACHLYVDKKTESIIGKSVIHRLKHPQIKMMISTLFPEY